MVSNAAAHRMGELVPLIIPEVNAHHLDLVARQPWSGALVTNPNCAAVGLAVGLALSTRSLGSRAWSRRRSRRSPEPVCRALPQRASWTTSSPSSAERSTSSPVSRKDSRDAHAGGPGAGGLPGERILHQGCRAGRPSNGRVGGPGRPAVGRRCNRGLRGIPRFGCLWPSPERARAAAGGLAWRRPPTAASRPRPRRGNDRVGRPYPPCEVLDSKFFVLSHNLVRGAAGAALLNAELCHAQGVLGSE